MKTALRTPSDNAGPTKSRFRVLVADTTGGALDVRRIEAAIEAAFATCDYASAEISVAIVTDEAIHDLNRRYLDHDYATDVLSFNLGAGDDHLVGEIVASRDTAERTSVEVGWDSGDELLLYIVHGALHLAGYCDKSPADANYMRAREAAVLDQLGVRRSPQDRRWHAGAADATEEEAHAP